MARTPSPIRRTRTTLAVAALAALILPAAAAAAEPGLAQQWALANTGQRIAGVSGVAGADVGARKAWKVSRGAGVTVGVIDSGVAANHRDLRVSLAESLLGGSAGDDNGHGTAIAGLVSAPVDGRGMAGLAPLASVASLRVLDAGGHAEDASAAAAVERAAALGLRIVNLSMASRQPVPQLQAAIAAHPEILFVVAAGNDGEDLETVPAYPCADPAENILCVGASDARDRPLANSNRGAAAVDLFAPGEHLLAPAPGGGYVYASGTSMAAPLVAATAALLLSARPTLDTAALKAAILSTVDRVPALGASVTGGRLDAGDALSALRPATAAPRRSA